MEPKGKKKRRWCSTHLQLVMLPKVVSNLYCSSTTLKLKGACHCFILHLFILIIANKFKISGLIPVPTAHRIAVILACWMVYWLVQPSIIDKYRLVPIYMVYGMHLSDWYQNPDWELPLPIPCSFYKLIIFCMLEHGLTCCSILFSMDEYIVRWNG